MSQFAMKLNKTLKFLEYHMANDSLPKVLGNGRQREQTFCWSYIQQYWCQNQYTLQIDLLRNGKIYVSTVQYLIN